MVSPVMTQIDNDVSRLGWQIWIGQRAAEQRLQSCSEADDNSVLSTHGLLGAHSSSPDSLGLVCS